MSTRNWTDAQQNAISDEGGALLVSAAAGSGKTAVLVERAVRLITHGDTPLLADKLLILTFTNAAAEELRSRIAVRLEDEMRAHPDDILLRRQRLLLRRAFIGTMDAFCQSLVRENFSRLNIPPDIVVGDASLLLGLSQTALAETMEEMHETPEFETFCALYGRARSDKEAERAILSLYDFTRTLPQPHTHLARFADMYKANVPLLGTLWGQELLRYAQTALSSALGQARLAYKAAECEDALQAYLPALAEDIVRIGEALAAANNHNWDTAYTLLRSYVFPRLATVRGNDGAEKERVKALRDTVKSVVKELLRYCFAATEAEFEQDGLVLAPLVRVLCDAVRMYETKYYDAKLVEKALDFADFEQLALILLQTEAGERTPLAAQISRKYGVVMVDEYQDTNELQDALYSSLASPEGDNIFYVGDVKQSIYRFRKANPALFLDKKHSWAPYSSGQHPAVLTLGHNFRSAPGVIDGVNFFFSALMSRELGEIEYTEDECLLSGELAIRDEQASSSEASTSPRAESPEQLEQPENVAETPFVEAPPAVKLLIFEDPETAGDAAGVAAEIAQMVKDGALVRDGGAMRRCTYGDFCILLRARRHMTAHVEALEALNIPVAADAAAGEMLQAPEILPLIAVLGVLDNPGDDVNLVAALVGPMFHFTPDEMTRMRALRPRGGLWLALLQSEEPKAREFVRWVTLFRTYAAEEPVGRLCEEIVHSHGYLSAVSAMQGGTVRRENLTRFIAWAGEVSAGGRGRLAGFMRLLAAGKGPADAPAKGVPGHVNIITIHKSKGLEFPICILADASHAFNKQDLAGRVQKHADLGVAMWLREGAVLYPTLQALAVRHRIEQETLSEEMRVLYVALTRAKDTLIISLAHKTPPAYLASRAAGLGGEAPSSFLLGRCASMADWIVCAALCHPDAFLLMQYTQGAMLPCLPAAGHIAMGVYPLPQLQTVQKPEYEITAMPDDALVDTLTQSFGAVYPRAALVGVPVKLSVSAIAKAGVAGPRARPSFMYSGGLTAAEKGSAQHAFMQYADYARASASPEDEVSRLVEQGFLHPDAAVSLNLQGIRAFLASGLAQRIQTAQSFLREYDFITAVPAKVINPLLDEALAHENVLVQGIADAILVQNGEVEIVDYKTDRGVEPHELVKRYETQLALYRRAIEKRLALPVTRLTIWSFALSCEVDVPLEGSN